MPVPIFSGMTSEKRCSPLSDTCVVYLTLADQVIETDGTVAGADRGALFLARQGIRMDLALGDFDSVEAEDMDLIHAFSKEVIRLNPVKDDSDSEAIARELFHRGFEQLILVGAFGGRADHSYVNLKLAERYPGRIVLMNRQNKAVVLKKGTYQVAKEEYSYISFFALTDSVITLHGMKYPLCEKLLNPSELYGLSNEILKEQAEVIIHSGLILMMQTRDRT